MEERARAHARFQFIRYYCYKQFVMNPLVVVMAVFMVDSAPTAKKHIEKHQRKRGVEDENKLYALFT